MLSFNRPIKGFSLIELLITIALIAFLAFMALPMTAAWIDGPDVNKTQTGFTKAYTLAKNIAIREGAAQTANGASSALCLITNADGTRRIIVRSQTGEVGDENRQPAHCNDGGEVVYSQDIANGVSIKYGATASTDFKCACFTSKGAIAPITTTNCTAAQNCLNPSVAANDRFTFSKGDINETVTLF